MSNFVIITDSSCDLPHDYYKEHDVKLLHLSCHIGDVIYDGINNIISEEEFYKQIRGGALPTTSQVNPEQAKAVMEEALKENKNVLYVAFSSGLSGTYQSGVIAANEVNEENPDANVVVVDTVCASVGEGVILHYAIKMRDEGKSIEETAKWLEENKCHVAHVVTVDDLNHLHRGGRISKTSAVLGSMINIKPMIHVNDEGKLINVGKMRGRKKALNNLLEMMEERIGDYKTKDKNEIIMISHSDCLEDAQYVAECVKEKYGFDNILISYIGPVIGSHTGPGAIALCFMADHR